MAMKREQETIICAADPASLEGVPREVKILPLGRVQSMKGTFEVDDESCRTIMAQFKGRHLDLVIDYEHQTLKDVQAPAGGWIKDIYKGDDALVAKVEWTPKAQEYLKNREYRYLSPVVTVRRKDRKAIGLHSVALTNTPAIDGMFAIVNSAGFPAGEIDDPQGGENMEFLKALAAMLGLPETATEEDVKNAVDALLKKGTEVVANSTILSMLGLENDAKTEDVTGKIQQMKNGGDVAEELAALKQQIAKKDADEAVALALKDGKISAAQKEWASQYALKDPEGFSGFLEKASPVVPMGKFGADQLAVHKKGEVDSVVLKNLGMSKEDIEKYGDKEA